jgi:hypothetical protein
MAVTIQKAYNKKLQKLKGVDEVQNIKIGNPTDYENNYRKYLKCENFNSGCIAGIVFAIRKGTGYHYICIRQRSRRS